MTEHVPAPRNEPPLPLLIGTQKTVASEKYLRESIYILRDVAFLSGVCVVDWQCARSIGKMTGLVNVLLAFVLFIVVLLAGYLAVACWGRQQKRARMLRLSCDMVVTGLVVVGLTHSTKMFNIVVLFVVNFVFAASGLIISSAIAPTRKLGMYDNPEWDEESRQAHTERVD